MAGTRCEQQDTARTRDERRLMRSHLQINGLASSTNEKGKRAHRIERQPGKDCEKREGPLIRRNVNTNSLMVYDSYIYVIFAVYNV